VEEKIKAERSVLSLLGSQRTIGLWSLPIDHQLRHDLAEALWVLHLIIDIVILVCFAYSSYSADPKKGMETQTIN
jgi:hypothetical protein